MPPRPSPSAAPSGSRKPQARSLRTREALLAAARRLAEERGSLDAVTADAIVAEAQVAKGTLFAHFGDMDGLLSHVLLNRLADLVSQTEPADPSASPVVPTVAPPVAPSDPMGVLLDKMSRLIRVISSDQTVLRIFLNKTGYGSGHCAPEFVEILSRLDQELAGFLGLWQQAGDWKPAIRGDLAPEILTDGLIAFMVHAALKFRSGEVPELDACLARLALQTRAYLLAAPSVAT